MARYRFHGERNCCEQEEYYRGGGRWQLRKRRAGSFPALAKTAGKVHAGALGPAFGHHMSCINLIQRIRGTPSARYATKLTKSPGLADDTSSREELHLAGTVGGETWFTTFAACSLVAERSPQSKWHLLAVCLTSTTKDSFSPGGTLIR